MKTTIKTWVSAFGQQSITSHTNTKLVVSRLECENMIRSGKAPDGSRLQRTHLRLHETNKTPQKEYWYLKYKEVDTYKYAVRQVNIEVDTQNGCVTSMDGNNFVTNCHYLTGGCQLFAGNFLIWEMDHYFTVASQYCGPTTFAPDLCVVSPESIYCPQANILLTDLFRPYSCGKLIGHSRLISSVHLATQLAKIVYPTIL